MSCLKSLVIILLLIVPPLDIAAQVSAKPAGVYLRYEEGALAEIMMVRSSGVFTAYLFNKEDQLRNIEKGKWFARADTIHFKFDQILSSDDLIHWDESSPETMKPVAYPFTIFPNGTLKISRNLYYPETRGGK